MTSRTAGLPSPGDFVSRALLPILATLYLLNFSNLFLRTSFGVMAPELEREMGFSPAVLSTIASALFIAYALMQIPTGMMLDRYGPRRVLSVMLLFTAAGTALFALGSIVADADDGPRPDGHRLCGRVHGGVLHHRDVAAAGSHRDADRRAQQLRRGRQSLCDGAACGPDRADRLARELLAVHGLDPAAHGRARRLRPRYAARSPAATGEERDVCRSACPARARPFASRACGGCC